MDSSPAQQQDFASSVRSLPIEQLVNFLERTAAAVAGSGSGNRGSSPRNALLQLPLHMAVTFGRVDVVQKLLEKGAHDINGANSSNGTTPMHVAAIYRSAEVVRALLVAGADAGLRDHNNRTALDCAVSVGEVGVVRELIEHGVDVAHDKFRGAAGNTALHCAVDHSYAEMVSLLCLRGGFDANVVSDDGWTPLHSAALLGNADSSTTDALFAAGADAAMRRGGNSFSALDVAAAQGHGGILRAILPHLDDVNSSDANGLTALHYATQNSKPGMVEILVGAGANVELRDSHGRTPLQIAAQSCPAAVTVLLNHGAEVDTKQNTGLTPLHMAAAMAGNPEAATVVDILLRRGADENAATYNAGETPADVIGNLVGEQDSLAEEVERVRGLLANAPADRAWRRRNFLVMCRAHFPGGGRVRLGCKKSSGGGTRGDGIAKRTRSSSRRAEESRAADDWAGVASMLMAAGSDPISRMGDGAGIIFETIVGFL